VPREPLGTFLRGKRDRLGVVAGRVAVAELGHHQGAVRGRGLRRREFARDAVGRQHLPLSGLEVPCPGLVQVHLGPGEVARPEGLGRLPPEPPRLGVARAGGGPEPGKQVLVAPGDLDQRGLVAFGWHAGLAQDPEEARERLGAQPTRGGDQRFEPA
jgi:hypothetical protein